MYVLNRTDACTVFHAALINIGWDAPAGQMYSSSHDLGKLMQLVFRPELAYDLGKGQVQIVVQVVIAFVFKTLRLEIISHDGVPGAIVW